MIRQLLAALSSFAITGAHAESVWDGTWAGMLNKTEPVTVTISGSKVVGYTIRGMMPLPIQSASVGRAVSFAIGADYRIRLVKTSGNAALAVAYGPLGNGIAALVRQ